MRGVASRVSRIASAGGVLCLALAMLANGQITPPKARIPVKPGAWLSPLHLDPQASQDPLKTFQTWRRANHVTLPAMPDLWQAHLKWLELHPQGARRTDEAQRTAILPRQGATANSSLPGISSSGNVVPATGLSNYQGEIAAAINPGNPQQMVTAANTWLPDPQCGGATTQALYASQDGGQSWSYKCAPIPSTLSSALFGSDPSLAWDANGNAYAAYMLLEFDPNPNVPATLDTAIVLAKSSDGGSSWSPLGVAVSHFGDYHYFDDKDMLAIDRSSGQAHSHSSRLYLIWDTNNTETVAWSDGGTTWTPMVLEDAAHAGTDIAGNLAIGPDGTVYAIWSRIAGATSAALGSDSLVFAKSIDGGQNWTAPVTIEAGQLSLSLSNTLIPAQDQRGINTFGSIAADDSQSAYSGLIYVVYSNYPPGVSAGTEINVYLIRSTDGGNTWSLPQQVNDDASNNASHFFPWCAVDPSNGTLSVAWYDTRNDPGYQMRTQIFYAQSTNGGASFTPNLRITQPTSGLENTTTDYSNENSLENIYYNPNQYGDYTMVSAAGGVVLIGWTDTRQFYPQNQDDPLTEDLVIDILKNSQPLTYNISGRVTDASGQGVPGVTISAPGASVTTEGQGDYTLAGVANGTYTVTASSSNFTFAPVSQTVTIQAAPIGGVNFTATAAVPVFSISGSVTLAGKGLAGATVSDGTASVVTDNAGNYTFSNLPAGNYTLTASDPAYTFTPASQQLTLSTNASGVNFSVPLYEISGTVLGVWDWGAISPFPLAGVTLQAGGQSATSDANGRYVISGLPEGSYLINTQYPGFWILPDNGSGIPILNVLLTNADLDNVDFAARGTGPYEITGKVKWNGAGLSGVTVSSNDTFGITDSQGNYKLFEGSTGNYTLTPSNAGFSFQPTSQSVTIPAGTSAGSTMPAPDFTATPLQTLLSISGQVTAGTAGGLAGATVAAGFSSATTDAQGNYTINGVTNGPYSVDAAATNYMMAPVSQNVTLSGANISGINFTASTAQFSISGTITTATGQPLAGATVTTYQNGGNFTQTVTTDSQGHYSLSGLPPYSGGYIVTPSYHGYLFQPPWVPVPVINANVAGINFTASPAVSVSGRVTDASGAGVSGISVKTDYNSGSPPISTDNNGNYTLSLPAGSYTISPYAWNYNFSPPTSRVVVGTTSVSGVNFKASQTYMVSGQVLNGATGVPGVTVQLFSDSASGTAVGTLAASTTTDAHGDFYFNNVPANDYMVVPSLPGYGIQPVTLYIQLPDAFNEPLNGNDPGLTFHAIAGGSVTGRVTDASGQGITQIPLNILGGPAAPTAEMLFTDSNGNFSGSFPNGSYTITPGSNHYIFTPASQSFTMQGAALTGINFTGVHPTLSLQLAQTQYTINSSVDSLSDTVTVSSNVAYPVQVGCTGGWYCTATPDPVAAPGSATLSITGLSQSPVSQITLNVQGQILDVSQAQTITIQRQSVALTSANTSTTVSAGQTASYTVSVQAVNAYTGTVTLYCSSSVKYSCSVTPANLSLDATTTSGSVTISVNTASVMAQRSGPTLRWPENREQKYRGVITVLLVCLVLVIPPRGRRRLGLSLLLLGIIGLCGCGGGSSSTTSPPPPPPPPSPTTTTSNVTVYAQTNSLVQSITLTLNVTTQN